MIDDGPPTERDGRRAAGQPSEARPADPEVMPWPFVSDGVQPARRRRSDRVHGGLPPERVAEIRRRILRGQYDAAAVLEVVARRLLASGDLLSR